MNISVTAQLFKTALLIRSVPGRCLCGTSPIVTMHEGMYRHITIYALRKIRSAAAASIPISLVLLPFRLPQLLAEHDADQKTLREYLIKPRMKLTGRFCYLRIRWYTMSPNPSFSKASPEIAIWMVYEYAIHQTMWSSFTSLQRTPYHRDDDNETRITMKH